MVRMWERSTFHRVGVAVSSRFSTNTFLEATILGKILEAAGPNASVVSLHGGSHALAEVFASYLGSGYRSKFVEYTTSDPRLTKCCLQRTAASVFGSFDPFSMTELVVNCFKCAETRDRMVTRPAFRKAIFTNKFSIPGLVDVVAIFVSVGPYVVKYTKRTGRRDDGDRFVVGSSVVSISFECTHYCFAV